MTLLFIVLAFFISRDKCYQKDVRSDNVTRMVISIVPFEYHYPVNLERDAMTRIKDTIVIKDRSAVNQIYRYLHLAETGKSTSANEIGDYRLYGKIYNEDALMKSFFYSSAKQLVIGNRLFEKDRGLLNYIMAIPEVKSYVLKKGKL